MTATVNDVEHIESTSYNGVGVIKVFLQPGASVDAGVAQITAVAQTVLKQMPPGSDAAADHPLQRLHRADSAIQHHQQNHVRTGHLRPDLNQIRVGLSTVRGAVMPWPYGGRTRLVSVDLDLPALKSKGLGARWTSSTPSARKISCCPAARPRLGHRIRPGNQRHDAHAGGVE
jgi:multidrug efflux pump subunit AcrB